MDLLTIAGFALGLIAVLGGNVLEGGHLSALLNLPAFIIVVGGTLGASLIQTPKNVFLRLLSICHWIFKPPNLDYRYNIDKIVSWSHTARREGLLGLENASENESDPFARKGLQLLVDGSEPDSIRSVLETDLYARERLDIQSAKVLDGMGGYAPTIGIIGAVLGLIHVMGNLADPTMLGSGIATAFVATIYGVGFANLFLIPAGNKIKIIAQNHSQLREMLLEGLVSISEGENPRTIEMKLLGYLLDQNIELKDM